MGVCGRPSCAGGASDYPGPAPKRDPINRGPLMESVMVMDIRKPIVKAVLPHESIPQCLSPYLSLSTSGYHREQ